MNAEEYKEELWNFDKEELRTMYRHTQQISSHNPKMLSLSRLELVYELCKLELGYNVGRINNEKSIKKN